MNKVSKPFNSDFVNRGILWRKSAVKARSADSSKMSEIAQASTFCVLCGSGSLKVLGQIYGFNYCSCDHCGHVFTKELVALDAVNIYQADSYGFLERSPGHDLMNLEEYGNRVGVVSTPKVDFALDVTGPIDFWLDVGCGVGDLVVAADAKGIRALGVDVDPREIEFGKLQGANIELGDIFSSKFDSFIESADIISLMSVIEHVNNPLGIVKYLWSRAKKGSKMILEVPRYESLSSWINFSFPNQVCRHALPPNHISLFSESSIEFLVNILGASQIARWNYGMDVLELFGNLEMKTGLNCMPFRDSGLLMELSNELQFVLDKYQFSDEVILILEKK